MELHDARVYIVGLLVDCPYEPNPVKCPLRDIRKKPLKEKLEWSRQLTDEQIEFYISVHKECFAQRQAGSSSTEK